MAGSSPRGGKGGEGIVVRHRQGCDSDGDGPCSCRPGYQAQAYAPREGRTIRKTFASLSAARAWRQETQVALRRRTLRAPTRTTVAEAAADWLSAARAGVVRTRSGEPYKPSALRSYARALDTKLLPALGEKRLSELERNDVQDLVDRLVAQGARRARFGTLSSPCGRSTAAASSARTSRSTRLRGCGSRRCAAGGVGSPDPRTPRPCWPRCDPTTGRCGRPPSTPDCAAGSSRDCAGQTSTSSGA